MEQADLDDLYGDAVLDHCRSPRNHDRLSDPDASTHAVNPFCGDESDVQIALEGERVVGVGGQAVGCSINQATTSMLAQAADGKTLSELTGLANLFRRQMKGETLSEREMEQLGDLAALAGVLMFPVRIKCALLSVSALEDAIEAAAGAGDR